MSEKLKIQDLRLGNYILENGDISKVVQLDTGGKSFCEINNIKVHKLTGAEIKSHKVIFEPIDLTSEILLACGFKCIHFENNHYVINDPNGVKDLYKISIFPTLNNQWHIAFSDVLNGYKDYIPTTKKLNFCINCKICFTVYLTKNSNLKLN